MDTHRSPDPDLPEAVYYFLDFFDEHDSRAALDYHHILGAELLETPDDESKKEYQAFNTALELYPEDNQTTPDAAVELYWSFAESADPIDRQVISGHLDRLWVFAPSGALALTQHLWVDSSQQVYRNVRAVAHWAWVQGLLEQETWEEMGKVVPLHLARRFS